jgi:hypothetical protein
MISSNLIQKKPLGICCLIVINFQKVKNKKEKPKMKLNKIETQMKEVTTIVETPVSVVVELTLDEVEYIQSRLDCSSFTPYATFAPNRTVCRKVFASAFRAATAI